MKLGAKIDLKPEHSHLVKKLEKLFDFIEVYYKPIAAEKIKKDLLSNTRFVVHAPHHADVVNLARLRKSNIKYIERSVVFASKIKARYVIVHPGYLPVTQKKRKSKYLENCIKNLKELKKFAEEYGIKILVENLPLKSVKNSLELCSTPQELKKILKKVKCGFVLDFSHAYHASISHKVDYKKFIREFVKLKPVMFHLYDGRANEEADSHLPLGEGNLDLPFFISFIKDEDVTLEISPPTLKNYVNALKYLKRFMR